MGTEVSVEVRVKQIVAEHFGVEPESLTAETNFEECFAADSLDEVELATAFEEQFGLEEIPVEKLHGIRTIGDAIRYIEGHLPAVV